MAISANNGPIQAAWARENGRQSLARAVERSRPSNSPRMWARRIVERRGDIPVSVRRGARASETLTRILLAQIESFRPDVVLNQDVFLVGALTLDDIKSRGIKVVGQHAATPLPATVPLVGYDLLVSSFLPTVDAFRALGLAAEFSRLAFDPKVLEQLPAVTGDVRWPVTFVGSLQSIHSSRLVFLEELAVRVPSLLIWTPDASRLGRRSPLRERVQGSAAGLEMYAILRSSFATVNHHGDVAPYANNMRLYEATGVGTLLVTDLKDNLSELLTPGAEVLTYSSADDCAEIIGAVGRAERDRIASAGQRRTLSDHTYLDRAQELVEFFEKLLG